MNGRESQGVRGIAGIAEIAGIAGSDGRPGLVEPVLHEPLGLRSFLVADLIRGQPVDEPPSRVASPATPVSAPTCSASGNACRRGCGSRC